MHILIKAENIKKNAFVWWVPHVMNKRSWIISKVRSKYWTRTHKYGARIPNSVKEEIELEKSKGNKL